MDLFKKLKNLRILLIDDDEWIRDSMSIFFQSEGCSIKTLETAEEALQLLQTHKYDILIVDYMLPGMDGIEFFNKINSIYPASSKSGSGAASDRTIKILITAYYDNTDLVSMMEKAGIHDLIKKPFTPESIENSLKKFV